LHAGVAAGRTAPSGFPFQSPGVRHFEKAIGFLPGRIFTAILHAGETSCRIVMALRGFLRQGHKGLGSFRVQPLFARKNRSNAKPAMARPGAQRFFLTDVGLYGR